VNLKRVLRQIELDPRDSGDIPDRLAHGRLPFRWVGDNDHLGTLMPFGAPSTPSPEPLSPEPLVVEGAVRNPFVRAGIERSAETVYGP